MALTKKAQLHFGGLHLIVEDSEYENTQPKLFIGYHLTISIKIKSRDNPSIKITQVMHFK